MQAQIDRASSCREAAGADPGDTPTGADVDPSGPRVTMLPGPAGPASARGTHVSEAATHAANVENVVLHRGVRVHGAPAEVTALLAAPDGIRWWGSDAEADRFVDDVDEVDTRGGLITAPFCDAHVHLTMTGQNIDGVDLSTARSVGEALRRIEDAARHAGGRPVYAHSWDETTWAEQRPLTTAELDRASYGGVVYMPRVDAHSAGVSSAMAAAAGLHGVDGWDGQGPVTRTAFETATHAFQERLTDEQRRHYIDLSLRRAAGLGIGLVHETGSGHLSGPADLRAVLAAGLPEQGSVGPRTVTYWGILAHDAAHAAGLRQDLGLLGLAGDLCADGSFGSRTAHLSRPYADDASSGYSYLDVAALRDHIVTCTQAGLQAGTHAIGDAALESVIEAFRLAAEIVGPEAIRARSHRLEHVELPSPEVIAVMADLGIVASVQPMFDALWGGEDKMYATRLGVDRALAANPLRSLHEAGVRLAFGSDSPVTALGPWDAVAAAVGHHNPAESIDLETAFAAHSVAGYRLGGFEDEGVLTLGGPASYVHWDVPAERMTASGLPDPQDGVPQALRTVVAGRIVHRG